MRLSSISEAANFEALFGPDGQWQRTTIVARGEPKTRPYVLELYRGFDVNLDKLERNGPYFILSPHRSEQGLIWFTHRFINGYDPIAYVRGRGSHLLTYPLECIQHYQNIKWSDGSDSAAVPKEFLELSNPFENSRYYAGLELPKGWVFSYKNEKFIGCSIKLQISPDMLTPNYTNDQLQEAWCFDYNL